jgi:cysteine-rich repeat protein
MPSIPPIFSTTHLSRLSLGACLALLAACPPDTAQPTTGDEQSSSTGDPGSTGAPTTSTTGPASTTAPDSTSTGPAGVCGDGTVNEGELCDDGNDVPDDGCNSKCQPTAAIGWTQNIDYNQESDGAGDVAIDATGRIVIAGWAGAADGSLDQLVLVLDPDGKEVWKRTFDGAAGLDDSLSGVVLDDQGRIYVVGSETIADMHGAHVVRALDPAAPDVPIWRTDSSADTFYAVGHAMTAVGAELVIVGAAGSKFSESLPLVMRVGTDGTILSTDVADDPDARWFAVEPIGDAGDLLLGGRRNVAVHSLDATVRRITADGDEVWTDYYDHDFLYDSVLALAVGPNEAILAGGVVIQEGENDNVLVRRLGGDGTARWTSFYNDADFDLYDIVNGVAFGPDFAVAAGRTSVIGQASNLWIRRFELD